MEENKQADIQFDKPVWKEVSDDCKHLIKGMTEVDPKNRCSFRDILEHKIIKEQAAKHASKTLMSEVRFTEREEGYSQFDLRGNSGAPRSFYNKSAVSLKLKSKGNLDGQSKQDGQDQKSQNHHDHEEQQQFKQISENPNPDLQKNKTVDPDFDFDDNQLLEMEQLNRIGSQNLNFLKIGPQIFNLPKFNPHHNEYQYEQH